MRHQPALLQATELLPDSQCLQLRQAAEGAGDGPHQAVVAEHTATTQGNEEARKQMCEETGAGAIMHAGSQEKTGTSKCTGVWTDEKRGKQAGGQRSE